MSFKQAMKNQLRSVIEWEGFEADSVFWQWTLNGDEIKNASKLIIKPGQGCFFVNGGKLEAVLTEPGTHTLATANIPFWTTVSKVMQAFESEHKVGIYFFRTGPLIDQKWGTTNPIKYFDAKYEQSVMLRAFGNYSVQIADPNAFLAVVASAPLFTGQQLRDALFSRLEQSIKDCIAEGKFGFDELDSNVNELAAKVKDHLNTDVSALGYKLLDFRINGTTFDESTVKNIQEISRAAAEGLAARKRGITYAQQMQLDAMKIAAGNEGGGMAAMGAQMAVGVGMGQMMGGMFAAPGGIAAPGVGIGVAPTAQPAAAAAPPSDPVARLKQLKSLLDAGLIDASEFEAKKKDILSGV